MGIELIEMAINGNQKFYNVLMSIRPKYLLHLMMLHLESSRVTSAVDGNYKMMWLTVLDEFEKTDELHIRYTQTSIDRASKIIKTLT